MTASLRSPHATASIIAAVIVVIAFHDVFFLGATLRYSDQLAAALAGQKLLHLIPKPDHILWFGGYSDPGGALWQSEPMIEFVKNSLWSGQSPYWNPYNIAGTVGPETLVDSRLSILSLLYAALGGGSRAFDAILLFGNWLAAFSTILFLRQKFSIGLLGATVSAFVMIRTGYSSAAGISNVYYSFLLLPAIVYAASSLIDRPTLRSSAILSICLAAFLSFTFVPTTLTSIIALAIIMGGYVWSKGVRMPIRLVGMTFLAGALVICMTAYLYWPIALGIGAADISGEMSGRVYFPAAWSEWIGLFTSSHFFDSYQQKEAAGFAFSGYTVYHLGVAPLILAAAALGYRGTGRRFMVGCAVCIGFFLAKIFGVQPVSSALNALPLLSAVGSQYWWTGAVLSVALLSGFGIQAVVDRTPSRTAPVLVAMSAIASVGYLSMVMGVVEPNAGYKYASLTFVGAALSVGLYSVLHAKRSPRFAGCLLAGLCVIQLTWDAKTYRFGPHDEFTQPTEGARFLLENAGLHRSLTIGTRGAPMEKAAAVGIQEMSSLNMGALHGIRAFLGEAAATEERWGPFLSLGNVSDGMPTTTLDFVRLSMAGVRYIVVPHEQAATRAKLEANGLSLAHLSDLAIYENPSVYPRAFFSEGEGSAYIASYENTEVRVVGEAVSGGKIVLTDNVHPFWQANVNGAHQAIDVAYGTFREVNVPAGAFEVVFSYDVPGLRWAHGLSLSALLAAMMLAFSRDHRVWHPFNSELDGFRLRLRRWLLKANRHTGIS